ncbi:hypothetical protein [Actinotalea fermentans]|uniref:Uncharacterized protein n=1 Tax=Actinotalea fermentans TaxID=43671 RepID=A0A511YV98_9CELL|nr:hypothetical protein [Actinotalea fermentans]GEN79128.1 hypothetical protein AFE02nite_08620 [Actinotalea fermentans]
MSAMTVGSADARTSATTSEQRAALARAVLARAEQRTGTATWVRRPPAGARDGLADRSEVLEPTSAADARSAPLEVSAARLLPVHATLTGLLPAAGLERGGTLVVGGSTSLVLALLAEASRAGSWAAFVGLPRVGVLAAHELGLDLARLVLVPAPGPDGPTVVAALLDGVDVVVVGDVALTDADRRRLSARARERDAVLVSTTPWPGAHVTLTSQVARWEGLGRGEGRLRARRLTVRGGGRGAAARGWTAEVVVPPPAGATAGTPARPELGDVVPGPWAGRRAG